jgi:uridine phosphorylase
MDTGAKIAQVAALVGDPARANMLSALMDGRTLTASELAYLSGVAMLVRRLKTTTFRS